MRDRQTQTYTHKDKVCRNLQSTDCYDQMNIPGLKLDSKSLFVEVNLDGIFMNVLDVNVHGETVLFLKEIMLDHLQLKNWFFDGHILPVQLGFMAVGGPLFFMVEQVVVSGQARLMVALFAILAWKLMMHKKNKNSAGKAKMN